MTAGVVTVPVNRPLREAVERMLDHDIGSVVVTEAIHEEERRREWESDEE